MYMGNKSYSTIKMTKIVTNMIKFAIDTMGDFLYNKNCKSRVYIYGEKKRKN